MLSIIIPNIPAALPAVCEEWPCGTSGNRHRRLPVHRSMSTSMYRISLPPGYLVRTMPMQTFMQPCFSGVDRAGRPTFRFGWNAP